MSSMYTINSYFAKPHPKCSAYVLAFSHRMTSMSKCYCCVDSIDEEAGATKELSTLLRIPGFIHGRAGVRKDILMFQDLLGLPTTSGRPRFHECIYQSFVQWLI